VTRTAVVTGATSGIGRAVALELVARNWTVIAVGRNASELEALIGSLAGSGHSFLVADLGSDDGMAAVESVLSDEALPIDLLVHAAGMGTSAPFPDAPLAEEEAMLTLNVLSTLRLSHAAANAMRNRGRGGIVLISSTAAFWSAGTYAASKSWVLTAGLGLRVRLTESGVRVLVVSPGFTRSQFHARSGTDASGVQPWMWLDPTDVAREALNALEADRGVCVPGRRYRALVETVRHLPPGGRAAVLRRLAPLRPKSPQ
jgi:hypothetical protein